MWPFGGGRPELSWRGPAPSHWPASWRTGELLLFPLVWWGLRSCLWTWLFFGPWVGPSVVGASTSGRLRWGCKVGPIEVSVDSCRRRSSNYLEKPFFVTLARRLFVLSSNSPVERAVLDGCRSDSVVSAMAPKKSTDPPAITVSDPMRGTTAPGIDGAHVDEVTLHISRYLSSYTALSVELLGRWPAYVPEDQRHLVNPTSWTTAELAPTMPPHLLRPAPDESAAESMTKKGRKGQRPKRAEVHEAEAEDDHLVMLKAMVESTAEKLRLEVAEKQKALKANAKLTQLTAQLQSENASLLTTHDKEASSSDQLHRDILRLEEETRAAHRAREQAEARGTKDRKARTLAQLRLEQLQKDTAPLANDHKNMYETLLLAEAARTAAEGREARLAVEGREANSQARRLSFTLALNLGLAPTSTSTLHLPPSALHPPLSTLRPPPPHSLASALPPSALHPPPS